LKRRNSGERKSQVKIKKEKRPETIERPKINKTFRVLLVSKMKRSKKRRVSHEVKPHNIELKTIRLKEKNIFSQP